jgi:ubiquinone/menaquinone biosynthesis C-methylase UbiE
MEVQEILIKYYSGLERLGPGSKADTLRALEMTCLSDANQLKVADIGCGAGASALVLASKLNAQITAVDLFPEFLENLKFNAKKCGLNEKIITKQASMESLSFDQNEFDMIWSEGAIYNIGFKNGIVAWKNFLKKGGILAVSEVTWTTNTRPLEIQEIWMSEYPEIATASEKIRILEENGYKILGYFPLSVSSWMENYYNPQREYCGSFLKDQETSMAAKDLVCQIKKEIEQYEKYKDFYSYGFYIASKL